MKRLIFFFLLIASIAGVSCMLLFMPFDIPGVTKVGDTLFEHLKYAFELIKGGLWNWSSTTDSVIFTYGLVLFLFVNAVLLISLLVMALTTLFKFEKVYRFYSTATWFLVSGIIFTGVVVYTAIATAGGAAFMDIVKVQPWQLFVPFVASIALLVLGLIFRERND